MTIKEELRNAILNAEATKVVRKAITLFGQEIELSGPTIGEILAEGNLRAEDEKNGVTDQPQGIVKYLIDYAYVPGTNDKVFEVSDAETLKTFAWSKDIQTVVDTMNGFMQVNVSDAEKN